ncbi:MAG: PEP-CTERM sorting domain-containing protein [Aquabacterium sp.]|nr:PEP-CTERM sorting domain-containing protein [Aquabacterium sp.]
MKKTLLAVAAAFAAVGAQAATITIDTFNAPDVGPITSDLNGSTTVSDAVRTVKYEVLAGPANGNGSDLKIGSATFPVGLLEVANASGRDSQATVTWALAAGVLPGNASNIGFFLEIIQSDGNTTSLDFLLNGGALASFAIAPNTVNQGVSFGLSDPQLAALSTGGELSLVINGAVGWDLTLDSFGFSFDVPVVQVPEPNALALVGIALAGLGFTARRRKA